MFTGFTDCGEMWRHYFEDDNFIENMNKLWEEVKPLYTELHTYVKRKLSTVYGDKLGDDDLLPAHILGKLIKHIKLFIVIYDIRD